MESKFENPQIHLAEIPRYEDVRFQAIAPDYWKIIVVSLIIKFLIIGALIATMILLIEPLSAYFWLIGIVYILVVFLIFYWQYTAFPKRGFAVRKHDILYRRGILATIHTIIPFQRVQHVAIHENLLARKLGLAQLQIFTAGGSSSDIKISGLVKEDAERMKSMIMLHITEAAQNE